MEETLRTDRGPRDYDRRRCSYSVSQRSKLNSNLEMGCLRKLKSDEAAPNDGVIQQVGSKARLALGTNGGDGARSVSPVSSNRHISDRTSRRQNESAARSMRYGIFHPRGRSSESLYETASDVAKNFEYVPGAYVFPSLFRRHRERRPSATAWVPRVEPAGRIRGA